MNGRGRRDLAWCWALVCGCGVGLLPFVVLLALRRDPPPQPARPNCGHEAPGFELLEFRVFEPGTARWARMRIDPDGTPTLLAWEN